jgi:myo-inositol 2-dehydrogenase / D-chiro-inositol 1-dehydrogenase
MANDTAARIAFVGAGNHATQSLYPNIAHIPEFDLVAVCDLSAERAAYAARKFGALEWYTDVDTMLDQAAPQGVCIVGPPQMHHDLGLRVLARGLPLFVEKPPALDLAGAEELAATAEANGTWGMVGFMKRFAPANVVSKEYVDGGAFGSLSSITLMHGAGPYDDVRRMLLFNGIHMLDLGRYLAGDVAEVFAYGSPAGGKVQAVSLAMRFSSGAVGQLNMNSGHVWPDTFEQVYLSGTEAGIVIDGSRTAEVMAPDRRFAAGEGLQLCGWSARYYVSGNLAGWASGGHYTRGYWGELDRFARAILGQSEPGPTLADGVAAMRLIEATMESLATGCPVAV